MKNNNTEYNALSEEIIFLIREHQLLLELSGVPMIYSRLVAVLMAFRLSGFPLAEEEEEWLGEILWEYCPHLLDSSLFDLSLSSADLN